MIVLFRSSEAAISAGSHGDETREGTRWNGKHKLEIIRKCYLSIQSGLDENDKLIVVNDRTTDETLEWMRKNTKADFGIKNIRPMNELRKTHPTAFIEGEIIDESSAGSPVLENSKKESA